MYAFAFHTIIFIYIKPLFNSRQKYFTKNRKIRCRKEKSAREKKCPLSTYALFLIFISINRFMYKEKSAGKRKIL